MFVTRGGLGEAALPESRGAPRASILGMNAGTFSEASSERNQLPVLRHSRWDALLVALAFLHGVIVIVAPSWWVIALGVWWNSNTIAHNFVHLPFFRSRRSNQFFSLYLSGLVGVPQSLWRQRHLAHHANLPWRLSVTPQLCVETLLVALLWSAIAFLARDFFLRVYLPGYLLGLGLCWLHGHYEHRRGTTSHYGAFYNWLFFNDGYHVEHHARPAAHWRTLARSDRLARGSRWPSVLRWLDLLSLNSLERLVLRSALLQRWMLHTHERALHRLIAPLPEVSRVAIVGGAIFPRTALILERLLPQAQLTIIDMDAENIRQARPFVGEDVEFQHALFDGGQSNHYDLLVIPLSFIGNRAALYRQPPARAVLIHDWLWRRSPRSACVSVVLLKRLNLVSSTDPEFSGP